MSKLSLPKMPTCIIRRERLERLISAGAQGPLTIVTGPPGAGKTVAMASWVAARSAPGHVAWMTLDRFDNNPGTFWRYLLEALNRALTGLPPSLSISATGAPEHELFLRRLTSFLAVRKPPMTLVLDGIHQLNEPLLLDGLAYVLRYASAGVRLIAASRIDPLLPLHRYRLSGELTEIRAADLAFTVPEARQLLAQHGVTLTAESLENLMRRNEGWAAGLRLAALSMAAHPDPERFVKEFSADDIAVTGYLMDEVLGSQPPEVREVLLKASILEQVCDELACELVGSSQAAGVIPELAEKNAFIRPLGHGWYRFHSLFADALQLKLRREAPDQVPQLRRKAARWLQRHGLLVEAVRQAAVAGDWTLAARIAVSELAVGALIDPLDQEPLAGLFRHLPADAARVDLAVCIVAAAMAVREKRDHAAASLLERAEAAFSRSPADGELLSRLAAAEIRFALARRNGDLDAARAACAQAEAVLAKVAGEVLARHPEARAQVLLHRGVVELWAGNLTDAASLLDEAAASVGESCDQADYVGQHALAEAARGRLRRAAELASAATRRAPADRPASPPSAAGEVALAWACVERNALAESRSRLARAEDVLRARPDKLISAMAGLVAARQRLTSSNPRAVVEAACRARHGWPLPAWLDRKLTLTESQALAAAGDSEAALAAARRVEPSEVPEAVIAQARAQLAAGDLNAASRALACAPAVANDETPGYVRLEARLVEAELGYRTDDPSSARRSLAQALRLADREKLWLPVTMQRAWINPVLRRDPGLAGEFRQLFDPARTGPDRPRAATGAVNRAEPAVIVLEPLTSKEREVLRHAARMLSTAEIAAEMYLSSNTVKSHFKNIFRKLGASHRGEAVRRAQQLNMLLAEVIRGSSPAERPPLRWLAPVADVGLPSGRRHRRLTRPGFSPSGPGTRRR